MGIYRKLESKKESLEDHKKGLKKAIFGTITYCIVLLLFIIFDSNLLVQGLCLGLLVLMLYMVIVMISNYRNHENKYYWLEIDDSGNIWNENYK